MWSQQRCSARVSPELQNVLAVLKTSSKDADCFRWGREQEVFQKLLRLHRFEGEVSAARLRPSLGNRCRDNGNLPVPVYAHEFTTGLFRDDKPGLLHFVDELC